MRSANHSPNTPIVPAIGTLFCPRKSDIASPMPVVRILIAQKISVISGTFAASGSRRTMANPFVNNGARRHVRFQKKRPPSPPNLRSALDGGLPQGPVQAAIRFRRSGHGHAARPTLGPMSAPTSSSVLVVTDRTAVTPALQDAIRARAHRGPIQVRLLVPNPAPAEWHPLHPERHEKAEAAQRVLERALAPLQ